jgi:hypothetical protein
MPSIKQHDVLSELLRIDDARKALAQAVRWNIFVANPADCVEPPPVLETEFQSMWLVEVSREPGYTRQSS